MTRQYFCSALALGTILLGRIAASGLPSSRSEKIERAISEEMARQNIPAVSVSVVVDGQLRWAKGCGLSDLENSVPAKANTVYRLGSVSKPITAVAVMQLVEQGKIDLDAPVQTYVPSFPQKPWPITPRQLLGHLGGIRHYNGMAEVNSTRHYTDLLEATKIFRDDPLLQEPGTKFSYSSYGYNLLGAVVESVSGMKFADYLREHVFRLAGMDHTQPDDVNRIIYHRAQGYRKAPDGTLENSDLTDTSGKIPSGGLCSTAIDLARFAIALDRGVLLRKRTLEQMFTSQKTRDGQLTHYGLGWMVREEKGQRMVFHAGNQQRVSTFLFLLPDKHFATAVLTNLERAHLEPLASVIARIALE